MWKPFSRVCLVTARVSEMLAKYSQECGDEFKAGGVSKLTINDTGLPFAFHAHGTQSVSLCASVHAFTHPKTVSW